MKEEVVEERGKGGIMIDVALEELALFEVWKKRMTVYEDEDYVYTSMYSCNIERNNNSQSFKFV